MIGVETNEFIFVCKWGLNGSSGHGKAKQMFTDASRTVEYLFLIIYEATEIRGYTHMGQFIVIILPISII